MVDGDCAGQVSELVSCVLCAEGKDQGNRQKDVEGRGHSSLGNPVRPSMPTLCVDCEQ